MSDEDIQSFPAIDVPIEPRRPFLKRLPITIEPVLFLVFFAFSIGGEIEFEIYINILRFLSLNARLFLFCFSFSDGVSTNILISRVCSVIYHLPDNKCFGTLDPDVEELVQPYTTKISMLRSIVEALISGVLAMFIGSWSDRNGRKPFIVFPVAG